MPSRRCAPEAIAWLPENRQQAADLRPDARRPQGRYGADTTSARPASGGIRPVQKRPDDVEGTSLAMRAVKKMPLSPGATNRSRRQICHDGNGKERRGLVTGVVGKDTWQPPVQAS